MDLKEGPGPQFRTIRRLPKGTPFNAVDNPQQGYYRVRTATETGWLVASQVDFLKKRYRSRRQALPEMFAQGSSYAHYHAKLLFDLNLFSPSDLNNLIGTKDFSNGISFGAALEYFFQEDKAIMVRVEQISKDVTGNDVNTGFDLDLNLKSTSIAVGPEFILGQNEPLSFSGIALLGLAPTTFTTTVTNRSAPNQVTLSSTAFTLLLAGEGDWKFAEHFSLFGELGFRYLKTGAITPTLVDATSGSAVNGSVIFTQPSYTINLTGVLFGFGVRAFF